MQSAIQDPLDPRNLKDPPSAANIKLSRTSSARPLLYTKTSNEMLNRLAVIIQDSKNIHDVSTKGKLPVEAAYTVMKRITEAAGEPLIPTGLSTFNKLQSLRTDPALKVLKSQTWKTFFNDQDQSPDAKGRRPSTATARLNSTTNGGESGGRNRKTSRDIAAQQQAAVLERVFANLIVRIEELWDQVHIPAQERQFYHKTAFKAVVDCYEPCKTLAQYIEMLELHKELTKDVIFAIRAREEAVKKCYDTLGAIRRKLQRISALQSQSGANSQGNNPLSRPSSASATMRASSSTPTLTDAQVIDESGRMAFWKEELIVSLDELRCASLEVIKAIQQWRRILWRPHAFIWCGVNYLYKMQEDMNVLETDIYQRILSMVPLSRDDILCVIFSPAANTLLSGEPVPQSASSKTNNNNNDAKKDNKDSTSPTNQKASPGSPKARDNLRASFTRSDSVSPTRSSLSPSRRPSRRASGGGNASLYNMAHRQRQQQQRQQHEKIEETLRSLLQAFRDNIDLVELHAAARVVIDEYKLQQAIQTEKDALHFKGVFIPLLKARKDLKEDDLAFYRRQHLQEENPPQENSDKNSFSQRPFSPGTTTTNTNENINSSRNRNQFDTNEEEELYEPTNGRASFANNASNQRYHINSMNLEPPSPAATGGGDYQADFYEN